MGINASLIQTTLLLNIGVFCYFWLIIRFRTGLSLTSSAQALTGGEIANSGSPVTNNVVGVTPDALEITAKQNGQVKETYEAMSDLRSTFSTVASEGGSDEFVMRRADFGELSIGPPNTLLSTRTIFAATRRTGV